MYLGPVAAPPAVFAPAAPELGTVAYEAQRLDRLFPGWWESINIDELDMMDGFKCVLGQGVCNGRYGTYYGHAMYGHASKAVREDCGEGDWLIVVHNYCCQDTVPAWTAEIKRRRRADL